MDDLRKCPEGKKHIWIAGSCAQCGASRFRFNQAQAEHRRLYARERKRGAKGVQSGTVARA